MQNRLVIDPKVITEDLEQCEQDLTYSLFYQLSRLTLDRGSLRHDDRLDALAMAVAYWLSQMDSDAKKLEAIRQEEELEKFLTQYVVGFEGTGSELWMDAG
tara:strand:- start:198 stop:500 length:303 start_codon:yes stop_codon:yes gene_type:complete